MMEDGLFIPPEAANINVVKSNDSLVSVNGRLPKKALLFAFEVSFAASSILSGCGGGGGGGDRTPTPSATPNAAETAAQGTKDSWLNESITKTAVADFYEGVAATAAVNGHLQSSNIPVPVISTDTPTPTQ